RDLLINDDRIVSLAPFGVDLLDVLIGNDPAEGGHVDGLSSRITGRRRVVVERDAEVLVTIGIVAATPGAGIRSHVPHYCSGLLLFARWHDMIESREVRLA